MTTGMIGIGQAVKAAMATIERQFGKGAVMTLGQSKRDDAVRVIPTGSLALDLALGLGGYPRGRIIEVFGPESSGKTTLAMHAMREAQRNGGVAAMIDAEHAFDIGYGRNMGIDTERLLVSQPDSGEQALEITAMLAKSGAVDVIVVDSVAALVPKAELEGDIGAATDGLQARLMSQALRRLSAVAYRSETLLIFVNQLRSRVGVVFGNPETTPGGNALKFYASLRLDVRRTGTVKVGEETVGVRTRVKVVKNKCAPPFREAEFDIRFGLGIDGGSELLEQALVHGIVTKDGSTFTFGQVRLGSSREDARATIAKLPVGSTFRTQVEDAMKRCTAPGAMK